MNKFLGFPFIILDLRGKFEISIVLGKFYVQKYKFHNLEIPLLAMKRESNLLRRYGLGYAIFECVLHDTAILNSKSCVLDTIV